MPDEWRLTQFLRRLSEAAQPPWTSRQIWIFVLAVLAVGGTETVLIPAKRGALPGLVVLIIAAFCWSRRRKLAPPTPAALLATMARDDVPADVIALVAVGKKIEAIKLYRRITGAGLREAKDLIDSL